MDNNTGRPTMLNSLNVSKTGLAQATHIDAEFPGQKFKLSSGLTIDPKDFVIGQRVYVGGTRPGQIAYIGETHFAPGEWVGVVLDEPNGKNDGCVAGKRYFQCDSKRGVFSRTNRLTLQPVSIKDSASEKDLDLSRATSPATSVRSGIPTKVSGNLTSKRDFQVGDRVIVSSGFGSRPGELKYLGETKFAAGTWCGVQLDEPNGKNDGSVDGEHYFECPDKYGIFVPIAKVSLSPLAKMNNSSRMGSQESLTSVGTMNSIATTNTSRLRMSLLKGRRPSTSAGGLGFASTPLPKLAKNAFSLQDVLKERQNYIEQLITERELDREDVQSQTILFQKQIADLKETITNLDMKLIEKTKKIEEYQSVLDESQFCGDELTAQNQVYKEKIIQLESKLSSNSVSNNSTVSVKCEECSLTLNEIEQLKSNMQTLLTELESVKLSNLNDKMTLESLREELNTKNIENEELQSNCSENQKIKLELIKRKENLETDFVAVNEKHKELIENINFKLAESNSKFDETLNENAQLKEIIEKNEKLQIEKIETIDKLKAHIIELQQQISGQGNKLDQNMEEVNLKELLLEEKAKEIDNLLNQITELRNEKNNFILQLNKLQNDLTLSKSDIDKNIQKLNDLNEKLTDSINQSKQITEENKQIIELNKKLETNLQQSNSKLNDLEKSYDMLREEKLILENEMKKMNENLSDEQKLNNEKTVELNTKLIETESNLTKLLEQNSKLKDNVKEVNENNLKMLAEIQQLKIAYSNVESELNTKNIHILNLESINKTVIGNLERNKSELDDKVKNLQHVQEQLSQLKLEKNSIEINLKNLLENSNKSSNETQKLIEEKNSQINLLQKDLQESLSKNHELDLNLKSIIDQNSKHQQELNNNIQKQKIEIELNCEKITKLETEIQFNLENANKLKEENQTLNKKLADVNEILSKYKTDFSKLEIDMKNEEDKNEILNIKCNELKLQKQELQNKLINENESLTMNAKTEISNLTESIAEKQKKLEEVETKLNELQMNLNKSEKTLDLQKLETERIISEHKEEKMSISNEVENLKSTLEATEQKYENLAREYLEHKELKSNEINSLNETVNQMKVEMSNLSATLDKTNESSELNQIKLIDEIKELKDERIDLLKNIELLNEKIDNKKLENDKLQENLILKENELLGLHENAGKVSLDLKQSVEVSDRYKLESTAKFEEYEVQLDLAKQLFANMEIEKEKFERLYEKSQENHMNLKTEFNELCIKCDKFHKDMESLTAENLKLQEYLKLDSSKLGDAKNEIETFQTNIIELENSNKKLTQENLNLLSENDKLKSNVIEMENNYTNKISNLNDNLNVKHNQIDDLTLEINNSKLFVDNLNHEKKNLETILKQNSEEFEQYKIKLKKEISLKSEEYENLKSHIQNTLSENKNLNEVLLDEKNKLAESLRQIENSLKAKNEEILSLKEIQNNIRLENDKILEQKNIELKNSLKTLEALTTQMKNGSKKLLEEKNIEIDNLLKNLEKIKKEFQTKQENTIKNITFESSTEIDKITEKIIKLELANEILIKDNANLKDELLVCETDKQDALNNIELFGVEHDQNIELIKENNVKLQKESDYLTALLNQKEKDIIESKNMYEQINLLLKDKNSSIAKLQIENNDLKKSYDIKQKADEISTETLLPAKTLDSNNKHEHIDEINFLNSIIAEMHKKNENLKARIDAIETMPAGNYGNAGSNMYMADFLSATLRKLPAPRLFCDICDEFDKHDTEDCPLQESDDIQDLPVKDEIKSKVKPPPRKYCESCEIFGHEKGECNNDESF